MAKSKAPLKEWEEIINAMSYDELQEYIADPEICYPDFLEYAKSRLTEIENNIFLKPLKESTLNMSWKMMRTGSTSHITERDSMRS